MPVTVLILAVLLLGLSVALGAHQRARTRSALDQDLTTAVTEEVGLLDNYFERARSIVLITSRNPAFPAFYEAGPDREATILAGGPEIVQANEALAYLQELFPTSIGEACFIDVGGPENARVVRGVYATPADLAPDESGNPFFGPTFALEQGQAFQAQPYISPDTGEWVISNSTLIPTGDGSDRAIVHFEVTIESFRETADALGDRATVYVVDANTGSIVISSEDEQLLGAPLGLPGDDRFRAWLAGNPGSMGIRDIGDVRAAFGRLPTTTGNDNEWFVVATVPAISFVESVGAVSIGLIVMGLVLLLLGARNYTQVSRTIQRQNLRLREQGDRLEKAQDERGRLLKQLVEAGEDERKWIAAELHDGPIQDLTALDLKLEPLRLDLDDDERASSAYVRQTQEKLREEIQGLRSMIVRLRPPALDERGLEAALADHARFITQETGVECRVNTELDGRLDPAVETIVYRVAQEALANVTKHARARRADVSLRGVNGYVVLEVRDDGAGFDPSKQAEYLRTGHFGLVGMRERVEMAGGTWLVESSPGGGTFLRAEVPR